MCVLLAHARQALRQQDAHRANFSFFVSPELSLPFDINDFDESLR